MIVFKNNQFREGLNYSLSEFKEVFAIGLKDFTESEVKACYKKVVKTNKDGKLPSATKKSKKFNKSEG